MKTELEENWLEEWNVNTLFPELFTVATSSPNRCVQGNEAEPQGQRLKLG